MKIVDKQTFLKLPDQIIYSEFEGYNLKGLYVKLESRGTNDWYYQDLIDEPLTPDDTGTDHFGFVIDMFDAHQTTGTSFDLDYECRRRDGLYDHDLSFSVYQQKDLDAHIAHLQKKANN